MDDLHKDAVKYTQGCLVTVRREEGLSLTDRLH